MPLDRSMLSATNVAPPGAAAGQPSALTRRAAAVARGGTAAAGPLLAAAAMALLAACASPAGVSDGADTGACAEGMDAAQGASLDQFGLRSLGMRALHDGMQPGAVGLLTAAEPGQLDAALAAAHLQATDPVPVNVFLLASGPRVMLIDAGGGDALPPYRGRLEAQLRATGRTPEQITDVLLTHLHADHVGGLARAGAPVFPQAVIHVHAAEARFWLDPTLAQRMPEPLRPVIHAIQSSLAPYVQAGRLRTFEYGDDVVPGVRALDAGGHTPGHTAYLMGTGKHALLAAGDLLHVPAVQAAYPDIGMRFETGPAAARASRVRLLARAAAEGWTVLAAHAPVPGIGHVTTAGPAYAWTVDFSPRPAGSGPVARPLPP